MSIFICNVCDKRFDCYSKLELHEYMHNDIRPFKCEECGKEFRRKSHLKDHLYLHCKIKEHKCDKCDKSFGSISILKRHAKRHTFQRIFKCQHCGKSFYELAKLRRHFDSHSGYRPHKCGYCERSFNHHADLKRHMLIHTQENSSLSLNDESINKPKSKYKRKPKNLKCEHCGKILSTVLSLKEHVNIHLGTKPHQCDQCNKTFNKQVELRRHLLRHTGYRPFPCQSCDRRFFSQSELSRHVANQHMELSVLRCEHCIASFCELAHLNEHIQTHFVVDTYMCNFCGVPFDNTDDLREHQINHHDNIATKCFSFNYPLIKIEVPFVDHIEDVEVNTQVKKYFCTVCFKLFNFKCLLFSHMKTHQFNKRRTCLTCNIRFTQRVHFIKHRQIHNQHVLTTPINFTDPRQQFNHCFETTSSNIINSLNIPKQNTETKEMKKYIYSNNSGSLVPVKLEIDNKHYFLPTNQPTLLREKMFAIKQKIFEDISQVKIKVDASKLDKNPNEVWDSLKDHYEGDREVEVLSCDVELTFKVRKKHNNLETTTNGFVTTSTATTNSPTTNLHNNNLLVVNSIDATKISSNQIAKSLTANKKFLTNIIKTQNILTSKMVPNS